MRMQALVTAAVLAVTLLPATSLVAEEPQVGTKHLSVFLSDLAFSDTAGSGSSYRGGFGLAFGYVWAPRISTDLSLQVQRQRQAVSTFSTLAAPVLYHTTNTYPVDLITHYHLGSSARWTPRIGLGVHYVGSEGHRTTTYIIVGGVAAPFTTNALPSRTSGEVGAGLTFHMGRHSDLLFDVNRLLRSDSVFYDPLTRASAGVAWRF